MLQQLGNDRYSFWKSQIKDDTYLRYINSRNQGKEPPREPLPIDVVSVALQQELQKILNT